MADIIQPGAVRSPVIMNYQGIGIRFVALLIDSIITGAIIGVLGIFMGLAGMSIDSPGVFYFWGGGFSLLAAILYLGYFTILEGTTGQTLGKMIVRIRVVREDGGNIGIGEAAIRNILRIVDGLFLYLVGAIFIWRSDKQQRLGDMVARTVVVKV